MSVKHDLVVLTMVAAALAGCETVERAEGGPPAPVPPAAPVPDVVTADIQAGIEAHIREQTRLGGGAFLLAFQERELRLKLVRVHTEYLANLGPRRHFACVDLADTEGDVYDVDFFLAGDPGDMTVTETTVHKINGQPLYLWEQEPDRTWVRVPVEGASEALLGVVRDRDRFEFLYQVTLPQLADEARMWIPLPEDDGFQTVQVSEIRAPATRQVLADARYGNRVLFLMLGPHDSGTTIAVRFEVERREKAVHQDDSTVPQDELAPSLLVPADGEWRRIAEEVVRDREGDLVRARALYDHTIDRMRYMKFGEGYGRGDARYACDQRSGNCTDFHSYFIALARSVGIPARFAIGAAIPSERDGGGIDGYHCWAEFYAEGMWWPVDISEGDKYSSLATYYFGHHPANRIELSRGRDLIVEPGPVSGPINFLAYPVLEVAGTPVVVKPQFSFRRIEREPE